MIIEHRLFSDGKCMTFIGGDPFHFQWVVGPHNYSKGELEEVIAHITKKDKIKAKEQRR